ncbi:MAG: SpoIID/LytB domain-containing protein [Rikenellaceae bacterium]|nr:SpoIID/LytB domain-containing protein [Rikenellaceae bacterium]
MFDREPEITVGILSAAELRFVLHGDFIDSLTGLPASGEQRFSWAVDFSERSFVPTSPEAFFELSGVVIGKAFHWEQAENQHFRGTLRIIAEGERLTAVNVIGVEEYLQSVISSEMSADSPPEALKAHAVISRSWLLSQVLNREKKGDHAAFADAPREEDAEYIRWYDRQEHDRFDVCADDHCQRYQGITRIRSGQVARAIEATRGQVLTFGGAICDARYSKCCGGVTEAFENVWEPVAHPYLRPVRDMIPPPALPDLSGEEAARRWIETTPAAFCHTADRELLGTVLNRYDQQTPDFYRWQVEYTQAELSEWVKQRLGVDLGRIEALIPLERSTAGRLIRLQIVGTRRTLTLGKELVIRRALSPSHLYSAAFVVDTEMRGSEKVFRLKGAGWGHGVGLCQIGAAVMGAHGYSYPEILSHYYPRAELTTIF